MGIYIADIAVCKVIEVGQVLRSLTVVILVLLFKENCPDIRNQKLMTYKRLRNYGIHLQMVETWLDK